MHSFSHSRLFQPSAIARISSRLEVRHRAALSHLLAILMVLCLAGSAASAQTGAQTAKKIQGVVRGADNTPLANASVVIEEPGSARISTVQTDENGGFSFAKMQPGAYLLAIDVPDQAPFRRGFLLKPGMMAGVELSIRLSTADPGRSGAAIKVPGDFKVRAISPMELVRVHTPSSASHPGTKVRAQAQTQGQLQAQTQGVNAPATFNIYSPVLSPSPIPFGFSESEGGGINENEWQGNGSNTATYDAITALTATAAGAGTTFIATDANNQVGTDLYQSVTTGYFNGATALTYRFTNNAWTLLRTDTISNYESDPTSADDATGSISFASSGPATEQGDVVWIYLANTPGQIPLQDVYYRGTQYPTYCLDWMTVANSATGGCYPLNEEAPAPYVIVSDVPAASDIANFPNGSYTSASSLQLVGTGSGQQGLENYVGYYSCNSGSEEYTPGHTYEFGVWLKGTTSDSTVTVAYTQFPGTFYGNNGIGHTFTGVNGTWQYFTWDFPAPGCVPQGQPVVELSLTFNGPGTVEFNGLHEFDTAYPPYQLLPQVQQAWADYKPSTIRIWSDFSDTAGGYQFWSLDAWLQDEWQGRTSPQIGNFYTTDIIALRLPAALAAAKAAGANPWLIVSMDCSAEDWSNLIDYLAAPAGIGYAAKRPANHPGPYVGEGGDFPFIYLEVGNEEWGTQETPLNFAYGQWVHYVASNSTSGKSYATQSALLGYFKFITNGFFLEPAFGSAAVAQAPESTIVDYALYNSGDTNLTGQSYFQSDLVQLPVTNQALIDAIVSQQQSDAANGHPYTLAAYESGPGADTPTHQGDPSLAAATATMDVDLYAQLRGFNPVNFFLFGEGTGPYTSHTNFAGGFIPHPVWEASQMRNLYLNGDMVWTVPGPGNPTVVAPDNNLSYPAISTYAFHDTNNQVDIAVISRDFYNTTPVTLNLPANATGTANIYSLTPSAGGDPSDTNDTSLLVPINSTTATITGNTFTFSIPPGSFFVIQIPLSSAWTTNIPAPAAPANLAAHANNSSVQLTWSSVDGASSYNVKRGTATGGPYTTVGTATGPAFDDTAVSNGKEYFYVVTAANAGGESGPSNEASATPNVANAGILTSQPPLDGTDSGAWTEAPSYPLLHDFNTYTPDTASYKVLWDTNYLYVLATVQDSTLVAPTEANVFSGDSVEVYFSGTDTKNTSYGPTDFQYAFPYGSGGAVPTESHHNAVAGVIEGQQAITGGYQLAIAIPWTTLGTTPVANRQYGFDVMVNDATSQGVRDGKLAWWGTVDETYYNPSLMGPLVLSSQSNVPSTATTLGITPSGNLTYGEPITLTATVAPQTVSGTPTGTVTFNLVGAQTLSKNVTLNSAGTASYATTAPLAGDYSVTATYNGSTTLGSSVSAAQMLSVSGVATTTALSISPSSHLTYGETWTLTATAKTKAGAIANAGSVVFYFGAQQKTVAVNANGVATYSGKLSTVGTFEVQALYVGTGAYGRSYSSEQAVTVAPAPTTTKLTIPQELVLEAGAPITLTASVAAPAVGVPTGTITFQLSGGGRASETVSVSATGTATYTGVAPADGKYFVAATYNGSTDYAASVSTSTNVLYVSGVATQTKTKLTQTPASNMVAGQPWTLTAVVTPDAGSTIPAGTVTFSWTAATATVTLDNTGKAIYQGTVPPVGPYSVTATYNGASAFAPSTSNTIKFTSLGVPTTTALTVSPSGSVVSGQPLTLTAAVTPTSGNTVPTGSVVFTIGSATETVALNSTGTATYTSHAPAPGSVAISAAYEGSSTLAKSASQTVTESVATIPTTNFLTISPASGISTGQAWTLTAVVTSNLGSAVPTGSVTFNIGSTIQVVALDATGKAVYNGNAPGAGSYAITANYGGGNDFAASISNTINETISGAPTSTTLQIAPSLTLNSGQPFTLTATVTPASGNTVPTGSVTFTIGSTTQTIALTTAGVATFNGIAPAAASYSVTASYGGSTSFASSVSATSTLTVVPAGTAIPLVIPNYSFEQGGAGYNVPTNWSFASTGTEGNYGLQQIQSQANNPISGGDGQDYWSPSDFNGSTSNGTSTPYGTSTSTLTTSAAVGVFAANTQYTLTVALADPADGEDISLKTIAIQLLANGVVVASYAPTTITPGGPFSDYTLNFYTSSHPAVVGQNITIALAYTYTGQYNRQAFYDNVRLAQTYGVTQPLAPTSTALSITPNNTTLVSGQPYTITAAVSSTGSSDTPSGSVTFNIGGTTQTVALNARATATYAGTVPSPGGLQISAVYSGDIEFASSTSNTLSETVVAPGTAVPITIPNYSFEANSSYNVPTNWTFTSLPPYSNGGNYAQQYISSGGTSPAAEDGSNYWSPFGTNGSTAPYGDTTARSLRPPPHLERLRRIPPTT